MWDYEQATGNLYAFGKDTPVETGYAGHGEGLNNPDMQNVHDLGPLPRGLYTIGPPHDSPHTGPYTLDLLPDADNKMFGRFAFRIHGDKIGGPPHTASDGCPIFSRTTRELITNSKDNRLRVVARHT